MKVHIDEHGHSMPVDYTPNWVLALLYGTLGIGCVLFWGTIFLYICQMFLPNENGI